MLLDDPIMCDTHLTRARQNAGVSSVRLPDHVDDGDLVLRRWIEADATLLHEAIARNVNHLRPWMPWITLEPQTLDQRVDLIAGWNRDWERGGDAVLGVFHNGSVVGSTGLHRRIGPDGLEIGYWIDRNHVRKGLATRASRLLTGAAFKIPSIARVEIPCDEANRASARVPEKLGFEYIGSITAPVAAPAETGTRRVYRMVKDAWDVL